VSWAVEHGARLEAACEVLGVSARTLQRWQRRPGTGDERKGPKTVPAHQLSDAEKDRVVELMNQAPYRNLTPEQAVAKLASEGTYVCSERSVRRILAARKLDRYRLRSKPAGSVRISV